LSCFPNGWSRKSYPYCNVFTLFCFFGKTSKRYKLGSTAFIKERKLFIEFIGWQDGYGAFTYANRDNVINYVKNQEKHHQ
jgi:hypothetical protein